MPVPYWIQDAVFYQIFPDRFYNGDSQNDPHELQPWGSKPTLWGFQGGDLRGIIAKIDYLLDLGVNALYLNPVFLSPSTHRYNIIDYYKIDPRLGSIQDLKALLNLAHSNQMHVILDGVFNHCSRGFFAFVDVLENQEHSLYRDWYHIKKYPVDAYSPGPAEQYLAWWGIKSLPKFNTENPQVRRYLLDVARYWIDQGADGWRLDVPNEIDDDSFWAEFRQTVKSANPDAYLVGEIWTADPRWVGETHFDGLMNYPLREALIDLLNGGMLKTAGFVEKAENLLHLYPRQNTYAMYLTLGSHDTERILTVFGGNPDKVRLAYTFLFAFPGVPSIYYGDEIGMAGGKDPDCRGAFPWDPSAWMTEIRRPLQKMIATRKNQPALRRGEYRRLFVDDRRGCYAFGRTLGDNAILTALNFSPSPRIMRVPVAELGWSDGRIVRNLLSVEEYMVSGDTLAISLPAWGGVWAG